MAIKSQVFMFGVSHDDFLEALESTGSPIEDLKFEFSNWARELILGVGLFVSEDAKFFIRDQASGAFKQCDDESIWSILVDDWDYSNANAPDKYFFITAILPVKTKAARRSNWDKKFAKLSGCVSGVLNVIGLDESESVLVRQGYFEGELDTGIVVYPESKDVYSGKVLQDQFGVSIDLFDVNRYLGDDLGS